MSRKGPVQKKKMLRMEFAGVPMEEEGFNLQIPEVLSSCNQLAGVPVEKLEPKSKILPAEMINHVMKPLGPLKRTLLMKQLTTKVDLAIQTVRCIGGTT